jgi:hypothetical protein
MHLQAKGRYTLTGDVMSFRIRGWTRALKVSGPTPNADGEVSLRAAVDYSRREVVLRPLR